MFLSGKDEYACFLHLDDIRQSELLFRHAGDDGPAPAVNELERVHIALQHLRLQDHDEASHIVAIHPDLNGLLPPLQHPG